MDGLLPETCQVRLENVQFAIDRQDGEVYYWEFVEYGCDEGSIVELRRQPMDVSNARGETYPLIDVLQDHIGQANRTIRSSRDCPCIEGSKS